MCSVSKAYYGSYQKIRSFDHFESCPIHYTLYTLYTLYKNMEDTVAFDVCSPYDLPYVHTGVHTGD